MAITDHTSHLSNARLFLLIVYLIGWQKAEAQESTFVGDAQTQKLEIVFPEPGDTLNFDQVRFAGSAPPGALVWVQGEKTHVYSSGAFVGLVKLQPGWNNISFKATQQFGIYTSNVEIYRLPPKIDYPVKPTAVESPSVKPGSNIFLLPGAKLTVEFRGNPQGRATFTIEGMNKTFSMKELRRSKAGGRRGLYRGSFKIPRDWAANNSLRVSFRFRGQDGHTFTFDAPGKLNVLSEYNPLIALTSDSLTFFRSKPNGEVLTTLPAGLKIQIIGKNDELTQVRLARGIEAYIRSKSIKLLPLGTPFPYAVIGDITAIEDVDKIVLKFNISERVPFQIRQSVKKQWLQISFYRALRARQWVYYPPQDDTIKKLHERQHNGNVLNFKIYLNQKQQWGYHAEYAGKEFRLTIRKIPRLTGNPDKPLAGLTIAVDPGHGGEFGGVVSATGLVEKSVNLDISLHVRRLLEERGAHVVMTRDHDSTVSLQARVHRARQQQADIFLSLHNNSIGPQINPLRPKGTSVYYTAKQSNKLAEYIYEHMVALGLKAAGHTTAPFVVTRQTDMISCLVEGAFLTHPEDELLLLNPKFRAAMAGAVVAGVVEFVNKQVPESLRTSKAKNQNWPLNPSVLGGASQ